MNDKVTRYGLVFFDIPSSAPDVYHKVKGLVDKYCMPVNLSVYVFNWGFKKTIEDELLRIGANTVGTASVVSFAEESTEQLEALAIKQLSLIFDKVKVQFEEMKGRAQGDATKRSRYKQLIARLCTYENLTVMYSCTRQVQPVIQMLRSAIQAEYKLIAKANEDVVF